MVISDPSVNNKRVGVKSPVIGMGAAEAVAVDFGVAVAIGEALGAPVGEAVGLPEGDAANDGSSLAWTTKFLVKLLVIPVASIQVSVIVWAPGAKFEGGVQLQDPFPGIVTEPVIAVSE